MRIEYSEENVQCYFAESITEFIKHIEYEIQVDNSEDYIYFFRGENADYGDNAITPSIYRSVDRLKNEHLLFREIKRFNNIDFSGDLTAFDHLSRMQHYTLPTRLLDCSEDPLSSLWFAVSSADKNKFSVVYMLKIKKENIKYYDSDTVTAIANLARLPLEGEEKSKNQILNAVHAAIPSKHKCYSDKRTEILNKQPGMGYLYHEIRNDISHYQELIVPENLVSVQIVKPKLTNTRIHSQKGAFLLFGLNYQDCELSIPIIKIVNGVPKILKSKINLNSNPIDSIVKISISNKITSNLLDKIGIKLPYIYPEMEMVCKYFKEKFT